ncbi:protein kinase domain-containing protein [Hyalangium gracile]|uniref:protein kinase domain-containing protein n=1 Tax=Hyalangium gracile TaxID=394092 RepID=UPI001CCAF37F|nr:tetratricopeptide repeat protein [Hyalangium gracile]
MRCLDEATFMALMLGGLPPDRAAEVDAHLDACPPCRRMMAQALQAQSPPPVEAGSAPDSERETLPAAASEGALLTRGTAVGRYLVLERLGSGGMGVVYAAYDPELDRRVALKLLRTGALGLQATEGRAHLQREAQAMARVSHPHVVPIYDVGTFGEQVFLAMELVEARTLRQWLREAPRSWREVRDAFVEAARGLAAAHAVGLVHGDIKPENLLVGRDGRVRVTDFGLARTLVPGESGEELPSVAGGTPAYMAPEQLSGRGVADARSDQFSLCVSLYEALFGERPFAGSRASELATEVRAGQVRPVPRGTSVPSWLQRVVLQGLEAEPARRHASIEALLAALHADPAVRRHKWLQWSGGLVLLLGAVVATQLLNTHQARACASSAERALSGVWDVPRQQAVEKAFLDTGRPFAATAWARVRRSLDAYTAAWVTTRTSACEEARTGAPRAEELRGERMRCLDGRLAEVAALTQVLAQADTDVVGRALRAVESLPPPSGCSEVAASGREAVPSNALREAVVRARALEAAGRYTEALAIAAPAAEAARKQGDRAGTAEGLLAVAELREEAGDYRGAEEALFDCLWAAEAGRHDRVAARAWTLAVRLSGARFEQFALARRWHERADAALVRLGGDDALRARLHVNQGRVLYAQGRYSEAEAQHHHALELLEHTLGPESLEVADVLLELSGAQAVQGRKEAIGLGQRAQALRERALGPEHPEVGMALAELAGLHWLQGGFAESERLATQSLALLERSLGPKHQRLVTPLNTLAIARLAQNRAQDEVVPLMERALQLLEGSGSEESSETAVLRTNIASALGHAGRPAEAERLITDAISSLERKLGPEHPTLVVMLLELATVLQAQGRVAEALPRLDRAAAIQDALPEDVRGMWMHTRMDLGRAYMELRRPKEAVAPLSQLVADRKHTPMPPEMGALARFLLAQALWDSGGDRHQAVKLATEAQGLIPDTAPAAPRFRKTLEDWLARHVP